MNQCLERERKGLSCDPGSTADTSRFRSPSAGGNVKNDEYFSWRSYLLSSHLESTTKHVLLTLSCYYSERGTGIFPSTRQLSKDCSLNRETVEIHIRKAKENGWLKSRLHGYAGQRWKRTEYCLLIPKEATVPSEEIEEDLSENVDGVSVQLENKVDGLNGEAGRNDTVKVDGVSVLNTPVEYTNEYSTTSRGDASGGESVELHQQDLLHWMEETLRSSTYRKNLRWKKPDSKATERLRIAEESRGTQSIRDAWLNWIAETNPRDVRSFCFAVAKGEGYRGNSRRQTVKFDESKNRPVEESDDEHADRLVKEVFG